MPMKHVGYQGDVDEFRKMVKEFTKEVERVGMSKLRTGGEWKAKSSLELLDFRKRLRDSVKQGIEGRKDQEAEIGFLAAVVWWGRHFQDEVNEYRDAEAKSEKEERGAWDKVGKTGQ